MNRKDAYARKIQAQLDEWDAEIRKLKARAERGEADARLEIGKQIETLRRKRNRVGDRLAEFEAAGDDAWEDLKGGLEAATASLRSALESAGARFK